MIKKHFKKLVSVALTAVMALGMTTTAFANEKDTLNLDAALMEKGYPQIVLDTMDEDTKMDIYNEGDIAFCGAVITYYDENSGTYSEIDVNEDGTYIAPRGQISTSDLSLSFTYSRSPAAKNTTLYGHYVHPKAELGLSVNVSSYGSFSISGGSNYDERGSQKTISW